MKILSLTFLLMAIPCSAYVVNINGNNLYEFETIQEALIYAEDGDVLEVSCDQWSEQEVKTIDLMGKDIIVRSDCPDSTGYLSASGFISNSKQIIPKSKPTYVPRQMIVKFRKRAADIVEAQYTEVEKNKTLPLSVSVNNLNKKHKLRKIRPLFANFKQRIQELKNLPQKAPALLTEKEVHILKRLKRAEKKVKPPDLDRIYILEFGQMYDQQLQEVLYEYKKEPDVEYAELNHIVSINTTLNDPLFSIQWPLNNTGQIYPESGKYNLPPGTPDCDIDAPEAWNIETGNSDVIVAVIDTGVDYTHRDLVQNMWVNQAELNGSNGVDDDGNGYIDDIYGYDFVNDDGNPKDDHGHGTHCSGIIAAATDNGFDIAGVCWQAKIMGLKTLGIDGGGETSDAVTAFYYAVNNGADVLSNSWGGHSHNQTMQDVIDYAYSQGVVVIASAGNDDDTFPNYPAYYEHVISVAATDSDDNRAPFSTYGSWVDIAAPGVDVLSLRADRTSMGTTYNAYTTIASGTSMACPHVSGASALLLSVDPNISVDEVEDALEAGTDPINPEICHSGRLNLYGAVTVMATSKGKIRLDSDIYKCSGMVTVEVRDIDLQGNGTEDVTLTTDGGDVETLTLTEEGISTGIFTGEIDISTDTVIIEDAFLQVAHDQTITATYEDANDGTGTPVTVLDFADVDCDYPSITNVEFLEVTLQITAKIRIETDEPTTVLISAGQACGGPYTITGDSFVLSTVHTVYLQPLISETDYYYIVEASDEAGNATMDDNGGLCYSFTTPEFLGFRVPSVFPTIQAAIDATVDGDEVIVEDGVFTGPGNFDIDYGGRFITVRSENGPENCIIDCNGLGRGFYFHSDENSNSVLDGITIINGSAYQGGGISCEEVYEDPTSPTIRNCIIRYCSSDRGAGIYARNSHASINNCDISNNEGDGIYIYTEGGIIISNCRIAYNSGNGVYLHLEEYTTISNCTISDNGGSGVEGENNTSFVSDSIIENNKGSGISYRLWNYMVSSTVLRCLIRNNHNSGISYSSAPIEVRDCIISGNYSPTRGGEYMVCGKKIQLWKIALLRATEPLKKVVEFIVIQVIITLILNIQIARLLIIPQML